MFTRKFDNKYGSITMQCFSIEEALDFSVRMMAMSGKKDVDTIRDLVSVFKELKDYVKQVDMEYHGQKVDSWDQIMSNFAFMPIVQKIVEQMVTEEGGDEDLKK